MNSLVAPIARRMNKGKRSGQSIIIIAFAFIALVAFVGIATDVALLFVRFSTLRRAVDAAAIAAAGQVRENANYLTMNSIAQEFVQVHGINPQSVKVETCDTEVVDWLAIPANVGQTTDAARAALILAQDELCKANAQKLVRVSAQVASPTAFLSLIGIKSVTLSTSSVSQTASLDVALVLDTSLSESYDTVADEYQTNPSSSPANQLYYDVGTPSNAGQYNIVHYNNAGTAWPPPVPGGTAHGNQATCYAEPAGVSSAWPTAGTVGFVFKTGNTAYVPQLSASTDPLYSDTTKFFTQGTGGQCNNADALRYFRDFTNPSPNTVTNALAASVSGSPYATVPQTPDAKWGLGLSPAPLSYINTPATAMGNDPNSSYLPTIRYECWYKPDSLLGIAGGSSAYQANYAWAGCCDDPTIQSDGNSVDGSGHPLPGGATPISTFNPNPSKTLGTYNTDPNWYVYDDNSLPTLPESIIMTQGSFTPRTGGSVPSAQIMAGGRPWDHDPAVTDLQPAGKYANLSSDYGGTLRYPFNRGDGNYSDLICRPFKDVRDAARRFIRRLDFVRGDRVVLVTFDSTPKAIVPFDSSYPIIADQSQAIRTLNIQVGVEVNPTHEQETCPTFSPLALGVPDWTNQTINPQVYYVGTNPPYGTGASTYWTQAMCPDTNMGGGIQVASDSIVDPRWIRRDAVWVMVVLSDGYPNRTPAISSFGVGAAPRTWLIPSLLPLTPGDPGGYAHLSAADINLYCNPDYSAGSTYWDKAHTVPQPQFCADNTVDSPNYNWGLRYSDPHSPSSASPSSPTPYTAVELSGPSLPPPYSFGFCPDWTWGGPTNGTAVSDDTGTGTLWGAGNEPRSPYCSDTDPDSRHFCQDANANVNVLETGPGTPTYICDPNYDAMDYAMDRTDFAGLIQETHSIKGNFIAMYSIFFDHQGKLNENILGIKMLRYIADAGDNGQIDNPIQHWYRDQRDNTPVGTAVPADAPPTGGITNNAAHNPFSVPYVAGTGNRFLFTGAGANWNSQNTLNTTGSPVHSAYSATDPYWTNAFGYSTSADPCGQYDYYVYSGGANIRYAQTDSPNTNYVNNYKTNCGQFFYANGSSSINSAFTEIAGRLFTRLSR